MFNSPVKERSVFNQAVAVDVLTIYLKMFFFQKKNKV